MFRFKDGGVGFKPTSKKWQLNLLWHNQLFVDLRESSSSATLFSLGRYSGLGGPEMHEQAQYSSLCIIKPSCATDARPLRTKFRTRERKV